MRSALLALLVAIVAVAIWSWRSSGAEPSAVAPSPGSATPHVLTGSATVDPAVDPERVAADVAGGETPTQADRAAGATCTVTIELIGVGPGAEVAGRRLELHTGPLGGARAEADRIELQSDDEGRCEVALKAPAELFGVRVESEAELPAAGLALYDRVALPGDRVVLRVEIDAGVRLAGRVVDAEGRPVAGAKVLAWSGSHFDPDLAAERETESDAAGRFELVHLGRRFDVIARKEGLICVRGLRGELAAGTSAEGDLELVLGPVVTVAGRVRGARGEPVDASLQIRAHWSSSDRERTAVAGLHTFRPGHADALTDAEGRFELGPVPREVTNVRLESDVYGMRDLPLPLDGGEWSIELEDGVVLTGQVFDGEGVALAGADVGWHSDGAGYRSLRTDDAGRFTLRGLPAVETSYLWVTADGWAPWVREGFALEAVVPPAPVVAHLERGVPLSGRVLDANGRGLPGVRVVLEGDRTFERGYTTDAPDTWEHLAGRGERRTGLDGGFRFDDLYAGEFAVRAFAYGERRSFVEQRARSGRDDVLLELTPRALERVVLSGRVVDAVDGTPVSSFSLGVNVPTPTESEGSSQSVLDPDGRFRVALPRSQRMFLSVQAPGYAPWAEDPAERGEGEHTCDVRLLRERSVSVRLVEHDGTPTSGSLHLVDSRGHRVMVRVGSSMRTSRLQVPLEGAPGVELPADLLDVTVEAASKRPRVQLTLDLRADPGPVVELVLPPREPEPRPFEVALLVFSADRDVDVDALMKRLREGRESVSSEGVGPLSTRLGVAFFAADGTELLLGDLEPTPEGYRSSFENRYEGGSTEFVLPPELGCQFSESVPGRVRSIRLEAPGHAARSFTVDPSRPNGGLPRLVVLRR